jgi:hypothetical protein
MKDKPPKYEPYVRAADTGLSGFSVIAGSFWRTAEKIRHEAETATADQGWRTHWSTHSAICLYHAALDCFINEEVTIHTSRLPPTASATEFYAVQGNTLNQRKLEDFVSAF